MRTGFKAILCIAAVFVLFGVTYLPAFAGNATDGAEPLIYQSEKDYPPFKYDDNYSLTGFDIDLSRLIFLNTDYNVVFSMDLWSKVFDRLKNGDIDTCGLLAVTDVRKNEMLFSKTVLESHLAIYTKKAPDEKSFEKFSLDDLKNYKVGTGSQQYSESILINELGLRPSTTYNTVEDAIDALEEGEIDVLFENQEVVNYFLIQKGLKSEIAPRLANLYPVEVAYGVRKDYQELVSYINNRIDALIKSGVFEELYQRYFFTNSIHYLKDKRNNAIMTATFVSLGIILGFLLLQAYISYLRRKLTLEQDFSKGIINNTKIIIIVSQPDGTVVLFNKYAEEVTGFNAGEMEGKKLYETMLLKDKSELIKKTLDSTHGVGEVKNLDSHIIGKNGEYLDILWNINILGDMEGNSTYVVFTGVDITLRKKTEQKLRASYEELEATHEELVAAEEELKQQYDDLHKSGMELKLSEERYRLSIEGVNDGIWDWDGRDDTLFMSKRCQALLGYNNSNPEMNSNLYTFTMDFWMNLIHEDDVRSFWKSIEMYLDEPQRTHFKIEYKTKEKNGKFRWILTKGKAIWNTEGKPVRMAGSVTDITEQKLAEEKIHSMAYFDSLTGLPNRTLFMDRLLVAVANAQRKNRMVAIYFLDLDDFKMVNDTIGHSFGDELLSNVSKQLKINMRRSDTVARLGGDEFIMMQSSVKEFDEISHMATRIMGIFQQPWVLDGREFYVTASIGISVYPNDGTDIQVLMKNADAAMYRAKEMGKNNFQLFTSELNSRILEKLAMENSLRKAIERDELVLYYQPQIDLQTGKTISVEALLRWRHPELGMIAPGKFIRLAEETGVIVPIGEWVLRTACKQNMIWHEQGNEGLRISVNLSARQFQQKNLIEMITGIISEIGMKPEWLELEITESIAMKDLEYTISVLQVIREMRIGVSLDDFGTEYSSLNYLRHLPISNLKIDKSFVRDITYGTNEAMIARSLISLAHDMKLKVIAEGVETKEQLEFLKNENCDTVQGFLFSLPLPAGELKITPEKIFFI